MTTRFRTRFNKIRRGDAMAVWRDNGEYRRWDIRSHIPELRKKLRAIHDPENYSGSRILKWSAASSRDPCRSQVSTTGPTHTTSH